LPTVSIKKPQPTYKHKNARRINPATPEKSLKQTPNNPPQKLRTSAETKAEKPEETKLSN